MEGGKRESEREVKQKIDNLLVQRTPVSQTQLKDYSQSSFSSSRKTLPFLTLQHSLSIHTCSEIVLPVWQNALLFVRPLFLPWLKFPSLGFHFSIFLFLFARDTHGQNSLFPNFLSQSEDNPSFNSKRKYGQKRDFNLYNFSFFSRFPLPPHSLFISGATIFPLPL